MTPEREEILTSWTRNVRDDLKAKSAEEIKQILEDSKFPFAVAFENWMGDFNMSSGFRNANGFNGKELFYIGKRHWDRRGAVGSHNYMNITHFKEFSEFYKSIKDRYYLVGVDNIEGSIAVEEYNWPENTLMIFGEEGLGLTEESKSYCKDLVYIPMYGSVRSFNCATASGIMMYDYVRKYNKIHGLIA